MKYLPSIAVCLALMLASGGNCGASDLGHDVVKVYLNSGYGGPATTFHAGQWKTVDVIPVDCPSSVRSCTLALSAMAEISTTPNVVMGPYSWAISVTVVPWPRDAVWEPVTAGTNVNQAGSWQGVRSVAPGRYDVELAVIYIGNSTQYVGRWAVNYMVTTP